MRELAAHGIGPIDLVANNLYPFEATVARDSVSLAEALENIDIGGPTLLRAAAKNHPDVVVLCDPTDYGYALAGLRGSGIDAATRRLLAAKAFQHVAFYDTLVAAYLRRSGDGVALPDELTFALRKGPPLRYGENPHQEGAVYADVAYGGGGIIAARQLHGIEISYNNIMDADAAWRAANDFAAPTVAIIKHNTPCGLASDDDLTTAYERALLGDPVSAFGGIVATNRPMSDELARAMRASVSPSSGQRMRFDVIVAPAYSDGALDTLRRWRDVRILAVPPHDRSAPDVRRVSGGFLVQEPDHKPDDSLSLRVVSRRAPTEEELRDLRFAWRACKHVKSNAIVLARDAAMLGMGAGQPNRVNSVRLAVERAGERSRGSVMASDAFIPFLDGIALAAAAGVSAVIEPGGSVRDAEVIAIADAADMALVFTGERHFRH
jgi:phosphoribosylaminoimidazolecarboxamide formyltransferase/IMP cyclohydrolase